VLNTVPLRGRHVVQAGGRVDAGGVDEHVDGAGQTLRRFDDLAAVIVAQVRDERVGGASATGEGRHRGVELDTASIDSGDGVTTGGEGLRHRQPDTTGGARDQHVPGAHRSSRPLVSGIVA
jgi:hypothetical protein